MSADPVIRDATPDDAPAIAALLAQLDYAADEAEVRARIARVAGAGDRLIVAERGDSVAGLLQLHVRHSLHRARPVGTLVVLVVDAAARGAGIGAALVATGERALADAGCGHVEVASNRRRTRAHAFYERLGYEPTSFAFRKALA